MKGIGSKNSGFTLIELVVVIALVVILAATFSIKIKPIIDNSKVSRVLHYLSMIRSKVNYKSIETNEYPDLATNDPELLDELDVYPTEDFSYKGTSYDETDEVVDERDNEGGWLYSKESGEVYANLPDGAYTGDEENEVWSGELFEAVRDSFGYDFSGMDGEDPEEMDGVNIVRGDYIVDENGNLVPAGGSHTNNVNDRIVFDNNQYENYEFSVNVGGDNDKFRIFFDYDQQDKTGASIVSVDLNAGTIKFHEHTGINNKWAEQGTVDISDKLSPGNGETEYKINVTTDSDGNRVSKLLVGGQEVYGWSSSVPETGNKGVKLGAPKGTDLYFSDIEFVNLD